jgi:hypothetical protein
LKILETLFFQAPDNSHVLLFATEVIADFGLPIADLVFKLWSLSLWQQTLHSQIQKPKAKDPGRKSAIGKRRSTIIFRG